VSNEEDRTRIIEEVNPNGLDWETRLQLFGGCFLLSIVCSLGGSFLIFNHKIAGFCILTSLGSILSLISSCFLMGPCGQIRKMLSPVRLTATILYLAMIVMTLVAGLVLASPPLAFLFTILQYVAMAWYSLSFIPYAREAVKSVVCSCC